MTKIKVGVIFNATKEKFDTSRFAFTQSKLKANFDGAQEPLVLDKFNENNYFLQLPFDKDEDAESVLIDFLSRKMGGALPERIYLLNVDGKDWTFQIT